MVDLSTTIAPKSDQLNADDLIGGPMTIKITGVSANQGSAEQPISIAFEGDNGKPFKPCKSMRRILVQVWGNDGQSYVGKWMTLFRDPDVLFGGIKVGGIRISHMSGIDRDFTTALTASKTSRKPYTVKPLKTQPSTTQGRPAANNGRADGDAPLQPPSLSERAARVEAALRGATDRSAREKAWKLASRVREDLDRADPDRLVELETLFEELSMESA